MRFSKRNSNRTQSLCVVIVGTLVVACAWLLTPKYGPWVCHAIFGSISLAVAIRFGSIDLTFGWTKWTLILGATFGLILALVSWLSVPIAIRLIPYFGPDLNQLYATLRKPPGPIRAMPVLALTVMAEELVWRGELVARLQERFAPTATVAIATISYSLPIVMSKSPLLIAIALCFGSLFTVQRLIFRSWLGPFVSHLVWTLLVFAVHPLR